MQVPYRIPGSQYYQWVDVYTRMAFERIIFLDQAIDDSLANFVVSLLLYLNSEDSSKPIILYINSPGEAMSENMGISSISASLAIYDTMQHIKSPVHTICMGQAAGTAAMILSSGTKGFRACLPSAEVVLTSHYGLMQGQATDIQIDAKKVVADRATLMSILAANTGRTVEKITQDLDRRFYLTPPEAKAYGLVDQVLVSPKDLPQPVASLI